MGESRKHNLSARLREHLRGCGLRPGDRLPGERELSLRLGVGRTALRPVLDVLEVEGVIERRPQAGTFLRVVPPPAPHKTKIVLIAPFGETGEAVRETDALWLHHVVSAFERVAAPWGARLELVDQAPHAGDPCALKGLVRQAVQDEAKAVVLLHPLGSREKISCALALLHDLGVHPVVVSARTYPGLASQVYFDSGWGAYLATRHLLELGHWRIGFAGAPAGHEWVRERIAGYEQALGAAEVEPGARWVWTPEPTERLPSAQDGALALEQWLGLPASQRPSGIVAANDVVALGLLRAARAHGLQAPRDFSLVGFDNDPAALLAGLSTIERPTEALGEAAARVTMERLASSQSAAAVTHRLRPVFIERKTTGPPP